MARIDIDSLHTSPTDAVSVEDLRMLSVLINDALERIERLERRWNKLGEALRKHEATPDRELT